MIREVGVLSAFMRLQIDHAETPLCPGKMAPGTLAGGFGIRSFEDDSIEDDS